MAKYVQSTVWLLGCSGLGYALLVATTPSKEQLKETQKNYPGIEKSAVENLKKKQQFVDTLKAITYTNKPLHRLNKEEIEDLTTKTN